MSETKIARLEYELEMAHTEIEALKGEADRVAKSFDAERAEMKAAINKANVARPIALAALSAGVTPEALDDVMNRAERDGWTTDNHGNPVLWDSKNDQPAYNPDNLRNLTPQDWVKGLKTTAKHFFTNPGDNQAQGGGSGATGSDAYVPGKNPWLKETWDDMAQVAIIRADRGKAEALAKAAGSRIGALRPA